MEDQIVLLPTNHFCLEIHLIKGECQFLKTTSYLTASIEPSGKVLLYNVIENCAAASICVQKKDQAH